MPYNEFGVIATTATTFVLHVGTKGEESRWTFAAEQSVSGRGRDGLQKRAPCSQILRAKGTVIVLAESVGILWILQETEVVWLCLSQGQLRDMEGHFFHFLLLSI